MGLKRVIGLFVSLAILVGGLYLLRGKSKGGPVLHVCTWSNYLLDSALTDFTKQTGIKVELSYISSNEELFSKLRAGATGFDIIQPSDYMVRQMSNLGMLQPLDHSQLSNIGNIDEFYTKMAYDPGLKYSVPFSWGTTGIAVNTDKVKLPEGELGWDLLFHSPDPKHTSIMDDMREVFGATLMHDGKSVNTKDVAALTAAKKQIEALKTQILMFSSEPRPLVLNEELTVAHMFSTDALQARRDNPKIRYVIPKEGATLWTDNLAIPTSSPRSKEAHLFINYFLSPQVALATALQNSVATPNKTAREQLPPEMGNDPGLYPGPDVMKRLQLLEDLGDSMSVMNRLWTELKS